jgi:molybdopterin/thiamine biosynthesis adenylyltransferase
MQIDEGLYSRQLLVLGEKAMRSMSNSRVLLSGLGGLGVEIAKNIVLGGVKSFVCHDTKVVEPSDLNFFFQPSDVGKNKVCNDFGWLVGWLVGWFVSFFSEKKKGLDVFFEAC